MSTHYTSTTGEDSAAYRENEHRIALEMMNDEWDAMSDAERDAFNKAFAAKQAREQARKQALSDKLSFC